MVIKRHTLDIQETFKIHLKKKKCNAFFKPLVQLNTTSETRFEVDVPDEDYVFCVQAQDIFTNGPFGPWSHCS